MVKESEFFVELFSSGSTRNMHLILESIEPRVSEDMNKLLLQTYTARGLRKHSNN